MDARTRWGPEGRQAAVAFSFDHLGEAADLEFGRWPPDRPVGRHHSALRDVPALLDALPAKVSFYVESWSLDVYPETVRAIVDAGHELGCHGMRHERWSDLTPDQERDHLERCRRDFERHAIELLGLRPPGGVAAKSSASVVREQGLRYISPVGVASGVLDGDLAVLETSAAAADVAFYSAPFVRYRRYKPGPQTLTPQDLVDGFMAEVERAVEAGSFIAPVCHPFMQSSTPDRTDPARIEAIAEVVRRLVRDDRVWLATGAEIAEWMLDNADGVPSVRSLEPPEWLDPAQHHSMHLQVKRGSQAA